MKWWLLLAACAGGCTDRFVLPLGPNDQAVGGDLGDGDGPPPGSDLAGSGDGGDGGSGGDGGGPLPVSCAMLPCTPSVNEGDVALTSGTVSGCHAYRFLTIGATVSVGKDPGGTFGFAACAQTILVSGALNANGGGEDAQMGPGAGHGCGSGGSYGGAGADPTGACGTGPTYGDPNTPRAFGSGGGAASGSSGGLGGGMIELAADDQINLLGFVTADGTDGSGALGGGGGSGGSILLHAAHVDGAGQVLARGGRGLGIAGGGGGGGRIAVYATVNSGITLEAKGGASLSGADGAVGTVVKVP